MPRPAKPAPIESQIAARLDEIRRVERADRVAAIALAAYFARRALLFPDDVRAAALAQLQPRLDAASEEEQRTAERYAELRTTFAEVERQRAAPPLSAERIARQVARARRWPRVLRVCRVISWVGLATGVIGVAIRGSDEARSNVLFAIAWVAVTIFGGLGQFVRLTQTDAVLMEQRAEEMHGRWREWQALLERRDDIVTGADGRWLRTLAVQHPALEFAERRAPR